MGDDLQINVPKLATDGSNWVTFRGRMTWAITSHHWSPHLTSATVTQPYIDASDVNGMTPAKSWEDEEAQTKELIAASLPDHVFNHLKVKANVMEIWMEVKAIYQNRTKIATVDLGSRLQSTKLDENGDTHTHFMKLTDLRE